MKVEERFLNYVKIDTQSDEHSDSVPTTAKQLDLARVLVKELKEIGVEDAHVDEYGIVYGSVKANAPGYPSIGLNAHMDTATDLSGANVRPRIIENYDGGAITLNPEVIMDPAAFPVLRKHVGEDLIVTDGTTLLGADDKAGIAIIMRALQEILEEGCEHGEIHVAFTPDLSLIHI